jgi:hypothetical protein
VDIVIAIRWLRATFLLASRHRYLVLVFSYVDETPVLQGPVTLLEGTLGRHSCHTSGCF